MNVPGCPLAHRRVRLTDAGRAVTVAAYLAGVLCCGWLGWWAGTIFGLGQAMPVVNAPAPPGIGLAPNLGPMVGGAVELGRGILLGIAAGLGGGCIVMVLICRYLIAPLARRMPGLTVPAPAPVRRPLRRLTRE
jgi:hypothetical protein